MKRTNHINLTLGLDNTTQLRMMLAPMEGFAIRVNHDESLSGILRELDGPDEGVVEVWTPLGPAPVPLGEIYHLHIF